MNNVLLTTYPSAFLHQGGGEREIHLLRQALSSAGIRTDIYGPDSKPVDTYQAAIHFSMAGGSESLIESLSEANIKLILWPNLWFVEAPTQSHIDRLQALLNRFQAVVFRSKAEEDHLRAHLDLSGKEIVRVAPLISPKFFQKEISRVFPETHGLGRYAIWTGIIEPQKNQLAAIHALSGLDIVLVISGWVRDKAYEAACRQAADNNVRFIPPMPFGSDLHISALANSEFVVELPLDFPGTSAVEAATLGCPLILSRSPWTEEMQFEPAILVDPTNEHETRNSAIRLLDHPNLVRRRLAPPEMAEAIRPLVEYLRGNN